MKIKNVKEIRGTLLVRLCPIDRLHFGTSVYLVNKQIDFAVSVIVQVA